MEIGDPLRVADLATVVDDGAGEEFDLVLGLPNHLRAERQCAQIAQVLIDRQRQIDAAVALRSEEHTSELQSLMRISYAVFCLKKKKKETQKNTEYHALQYLHIHTD